MAGCFAVLVLVGRASAQPAEPARPADVARPADAVRPAEPSEHPEPGHHADDQEQAPPSGAHRASRTAKRTPPDYDGRGEPPTTAGDVALWVPRVVLFPAYVVSEYVIRRPLGIAITAAERAKLPQALYDFFTFGPDHQAGWAPIAFLDFGFNPSVGLFFFWNDAVVEGHDLRLHASTWGKHWLAGKVTNRLRLGDDDTLTLVLAGVRRPDYEYLPKGGLASSDDLTRYGADRLSGDLTLYHRLFGRSSLEATLGARRLRFHGPRGQEEPSVREAVAAGDMPLPASFGEGYGAGVTGATLRLDSRAEKAVRGSHVRFEASGEQGVAPGAHPLGWWRYGATLGGFLDLNDQGRVLGLSVASEFVEPMTERPVPFTELVQLGGNQPMPGFAEGWLSGESAVVSTLSYRWPVWMWLDGGLQAAVGNVFGEQLEGFDVGRLRLSAALGLRTSSSSDNPVELMIGFGTEPFEQGARLDSFRFVVGTNNGF